MRLAFVSLAAESQHTHQTTRFGVCLYVCIYVCIGGKRCVCIYVCVSMYMYVCMYLCMYVCVCMLPFTNCLSSCIDIVLLFEASIFARQNAVRRSFCARVSNSRFGVFCSLGTYDSPCFAAFAILRSSYLAAFSASI